MTGAQQGPAIILGVIVMFSVGRGYAQERPCTDLEGQRGLHEAGTSRSWDALYKFYGLYRQCDDGAIAEGYSESVARILVDHWRTLPRLTRLARKDAEFWAFVLKHVDASLDMDDVNKIKTNAVTRCPKGLRATCNDLVKQANSVLHADASTH